MVNGESVTTLYREFGIKRSILYRWRDAYVKEGEAGLNRKVGRPPGSGARLRAAAQAAGLSSPAEAQPEGSSEAATKRIAELEQVVGKQTLYIDFLTRAFKRVKESRRKQDGTGAAASTGRSGQ
jgi:transposase